MKKKELLKLLESIPGNPEIVIWNGFVDDYQHIDKEFVEIQLVKKSREFLKNAINAQRIEQGAPELTEEELTARCAKEQWNLPNQFVEPENFKAWYAPRKKKLVVFQLKSRNKTVYDRTGSMKY